MTRASYEWLEPLLAPMGLTPSKLLWMHSELGESAAVAVPAGWPQVQDLLLEPKGDQWRTTLAQSWGEAPNPVLAVQALGLRGPRRTFTSKCGDGQAVDVGAVLFELLASAPEGATLGVHVPNVLLTEGVHRTFRTWLARECRLRWIVFLGRSVAESIGAHVSFPSAFLVVCGPRSSDTGQPLIRVARLGVTTPVEWGGILKHAAQSQGGESDNVIVLRRTVVDDPAWTFEQFSKNTGRDLQELGEVGEVRALGTLTESISVGLHRAHTKAVGSDEGSGPPPNSVSWFSGRDIQADGSLGSAQRYVAASDVRDAALLREGDLLVRAIVDVRSGSQRALCCRVTKEHLPATFDTTCVRIRPKNDVPEHVAELLVMYLNSAVARARLIAAGAQLHLTTDRLRELPVPWPSQDVLRALESLTEFEKRYTSWAESVRNARIELFSASSLRRAVEGLFSTNLRESERVQAADASQTLDYKVQNHFPHPIGLRRERIIGLPHGKERLQQTLECAEHLVVLLGVLALLQQAEGRRLTETVPGTQLSQFCKPGALLFDWGKLFEVLREGASYSLKHREPLGLPFPALYALGEVMGDSASPWSVSERSLRETRNDSAHLQRLPPNELVERSRQAESEFTCMLEAATGLALAPLVRVLSCNRDPITGARTATFELLVGASVVHRQVQRNVDVELFGNDVGFLDQKGRFHSALPWITFDECPMCRHTEVFVFNRLENGRCTYIAMESGHPSQKPELGECVTRLVASKSRGREAAK